jgi:hypothetical protein
MGSLTEFLFPAPAARSTGGIIRWWERRRLFYNVAVGAAGLLSLGTLTLVAAMLGDGFELIPWQPAVVFGFMANVCYLLGPAIEIAVHALWGRSVLPVGPALYRIGLTFSVGLALFPTLLAVLWAVAALVFNLLG